MSYGKEALKRGAMGFAVGVAISMTIAVIIGWMEGLSQYDYEIMSKSYVAGGIMGIVFGAASVIWNVKRWSYLKQTVLHMLVMAAVYPALSMWAGWIPTGLAPAAIYFGGFVALYGILWTGWYFHYKRTIRDFNARVGQK
jgi:hypothetical protein